MRADFLQDIVDSQRVVVDLDGTLDDTLGQSHIDARVVDDGISHQRIDHSLKVAHAAVGRLSDILDHVGWNLQAVATTLGVEDINAQLHIGLLQFCNQSAGEASQQTVLHTLQVNRGTIGSQDNLLAQAEQMVKDVEERVERLRRSGPLLNVIHNQHVDALVEVDEVVRRVLAHSISELHLEKTG